MDTTLHNEILNALGIQDLPQEDQQDLLHRVTELVMSDILISAVEQLPDDQVDAYTALISTDPEPLAVFDFFQTHIENFDTIVSTAVTSVAEAFRK